MEDIRQILEQKQCVDFKKRLFNFLSAADVQNRIQAEYFFINEGNPKEGLLDEVTKLSLGKPYVCDLESKLPSEHVIFTLIQEHRRIWEALEAIEREYGSWCIDKDNIRLDKICSLASYLISAEPHHEREEKVLFPEMAKQGIGGPPAVMMMEHVYLRARKHEVIKLAKEKGKDLSSAIFLLVSWLKGHIRKENDCIYPSALRIIPVERWDALKRRCDEIGYW